MQEPTLRQLRIFAAVARHLSYTRAAGELGLTQPAVSMGVRALEARAGLPLLERAGRGVALTAAGDELLPHAQATLRTLQEAEDALRALRGLEAGRVAIAVVSTAKYFAPRLLALFSRRHPGIELRLAVHNREAVLRLLLENEVDLALMGTPPRQLETTAFPFARHPLVVIAAPDHPLAGQRRIAVEALAREPFLVREPGSGTRAAMERFFAEHGAAPAATTEISSNETIKQAVMAGMGLGFISQHAIGLELATGHLVLLHVAGLPVMRAWNVVHRAEKRLAPAAQAFKRFVLREGRAFLAGMAPAGSK
ncbi:MAG TPA: LysR substrate-binding domain-containing protein [Anaeromyxobacteraceae bacterium]|nr:LysR substrate-binding domain-containing protein [Anaeromyxobacteraceae bacterium]